MRLRLLETFKSDYRNLAKELRQRVQKALKLIQENPRYPSLQVKPVKGTKHIWEARVSLAYRMTFNWHSDLITLRRVGTHDILKKESS